jgi:hypothetical protein
MPASSLAASMTVLSWLELARLLGGLDHAQR